MAVIKMMCVGKSGVGKSTIGNCMVEGSPTGKAFVSNSSAKSVTKEPKWVQTEECHYCDVPGLPDTDPNCTKSFYDMIIKEARKELDVILFVFKYERICEDDYKRAKMLFRELMKSKAIKVLVLNDMTNYTFGAKKTPSDDDYKKEADSIKKCLGVEFAYNIVLTEATMMTNLNNLKEQLIGKTKSVFSPDLKTFDELKAYVKELTEQKNIRQIAYDEAKDAVEYLRGSLGVNLADLLQPVATNVFEILNPFSFFFNPVSAVTGAAASINLLETIQQQELKIAESKLNDKALLEEATKKLEIACESFKDLEKAIDLK